MDLPENNPRFELEYQNNTIADDNLITEQVLPNRLLKDNKYHHPPRMGYGMSPAKLIKTDKQ